MERVSVCLPSYKSVSTLQRLLDSLNRQTYRDFVLVCSINPPDDGSYELLLNYKSHFRKAIYVQETNIGSHHNFLHTISLVESEYFLLIGSDDYLSDRYIERLVSSSDRHPDVYHHGLVIIEDEACVKSPHITNDPSSIGVKKIKRGLLGKLRFMISPEFYGSANLVYGLHRVSDRQIFRDVLYERYDFWDLVVVYRLLSIRDFGFVPVIYHKRIFSHSISSQLPTAPLKIHHVVFGYLKTFASLDSLLPLLAKNGIRIRVVLMLLLPLKVANRAYRLITFRLRNASNS